jgi:hypothetical protein
VGELQSGEVEGLVSIQEKVEVDDSWAIFPDHFFTKLLFDLLQAGEQFERRKVGGDTGGCIIKVGLV